MNKGFIKIPLFSILYSLFPILYSLFPTKSYKPAAKSKAECQQKLPIRLRKMLYPSHT